jgi:NAD+ synthase (glutamine-hydrolysing)
MKLALGQISPSLGDFHGNASLMVEQAHQAQQHDCQLIVFPELSLLGYHPFDLLERPEVIEQQDMALQAMIKRLPQEIYCLVGLITQSSEHKRLYHDSAALIHKGKIINIFHKQLLPTYDVFDDSRHFLAGDMLNNQFKIGNTKIQLLICEDMWGWDDRYQDNPLLKIGEQQVDLVVNMSASPFHVGKLQRRLSLAQKTVQELGAPLVYVNQVGAQDELIFDGQSFALNKKMELTHLAPPFVPQLSVIDLSAEKKIGPPSNADSLDQIRQALVLGIKDFFRKNHMQKAHLGLSGGVDSALVLALLAEALGPENVTAIAMPTRFNSAQSLSLAEEMVQSVGCPFHTMNIWDLYQSTLGTYEKSFGHREFSVMHENLQSRLRALLLMAFANDHGSLLVSTSNKSEMAMGYSTLYGDMCGALAPIGDLLKSQVYELSQYYCDHLKWIPQQIISREPSAELRENQKDSDTLPEYNVLDHAVEQLVTEKNGAHNSTELRVLKSLYATEFKRWQAPPILKVSAHAFGRGRRLPISLKPPLSH